jgi:peptide/nickel transport system permease protein
MLHYIARRIAYMAVSLIAVTFIGFIVIELPPGSYLETYIERLRQQGALIPQEQLEGLEKRYGLHDPIYVKFYKWVSGFVRGDFGESFELNLPVSQLIWERLGLTLGISVLTLIFSWIVAIVVGVYSATHRYTMPDYVIAALQFTGLSMPAFLLALIVMVFAQQVLGMSVGGLLSRDFRDAPWTLAKLVDLLKHLWVPIVVIGASGTAWLSRVMRGNLLDVLNMQYVQTARAKGLNERTVIWKHAVRNALHPLVMVLGMSFPALVSGETVVSIVLNLPTIGPIFFRALLNQDMYLAGTILIFLAFMLLVGNLLADVLLAWLDPRIRFR